MGRNFRIAVLDRFFEILAKTLYGGCAYLLAMAGAYFHVHVILSKFQKEPFRGPALILVLLIHSSAVERSMDNLQIVNGFERPPIPKFAQCETVSWLDIGQKTVC